MGQAQHAPQQEREPAPRHARTVPGRLRITALMVLSALAVVPVSTISVAGPAHAAVTSNVTIAVAERASGLPIGAFRYIINEDVAQVSAGTGSAASHAPLVATGDESSATVALDPGRYLVSVQAGSAPPAPAQYKLAGANFVVDGSGAPMTVDVRPLGGDVPTATLRTRVFHDWAPINNTEDFPREAGLAGFTIVVHDAVGQVVTDAYGFPMCTEYDGNPLGATPLGDPIPDTGGLCESDANGDAVIPNLVPNKYAIQAIPPDGTDWVQTSTIEGKHEIDVWLEEGSTGFTTEGGAVLPFPVFGFTRPCVFGDAADSCPSNDLAGTGSISGVLRTVSLANELVGNVTPGYVVTNGLVALNAIGASDDEVYMGEADPVSGAFTIPNVPAGHYQLVAWDLPQDYIIAFFTVDVGVGQAVDLGDLSLTRWFGRVRGFVYLDNGRSADLTVTFAGGAENGRRDCVDPDGAGPLEPDPFDFPHCEQGLPLEDVGFRFKDGTLIYGTLTDANGYYEIDEYFPWAHFLLFESGFARRKHTGTAAYATDGEGLPVGYSSAPIDEAVGAAGLVRAHNLLNGDVSWIDAGKANYATGQNGGISGIVHNAVTRNEFDPRLAVAEDYEAGIPGVTVKLYKAVTSGGLPVYEADGSIRKGTLLGAAATDDYFASRPTDCTFPDPFNLGITSDAQCLEGFERLSTQVKPGVFDGGYAFADNCADPTGPAVLSPNADEDLDGIVNKYDVDLLIDPEVGTCAPLISGKYVVEVEPPAGYHHIREEDQNTDEGLNFVPAVPPPPCAGALHLVDDPRNPAHGTNTPLCESKYVSLSSGTNKGADFFLMSASTVAPPALLRGLVVDDLAVDIDPTSPWYLAKRPLIDTPMSIRDFEGNEIARAYTDSTGYFEVLLPSTETINCPTPAGVCPGMVQVIANDPGDPQNPDPMWNPNFGRLQLTFDLWPGKTTYADIALLPVTSFTSAPGSGYAAPPVCQAADAPDLEGADIVVGTVGTTIALSGARFGVTAGTVTLDGVALAITGWSDTLVQATIPAGVGEGPRQLRLTDAAGSAATTGLTFHVTGASYDPPVIHVDGTVADPAPDGTSAHPYRTVQAGIDAATAGGLVLVHPGSYPESIVVAKNIKLQGFGFGETVLDGRFWNIGGTDPASWHALVDAAAPAGPAIVPEGAVVTLLGQETTHGSAYRSQIDGFRILGGVRNQGGGAEVAFATGGGGVYAHAYARHLSVSNNFIHSNAGDLGGGIVLGQPYTANPTLGGAEDNENDDVRIHDNRIDNNGGVAYAGGIGIYNGADGYEIDHNELCGNYSGTYGGGISHTGVSPNGRIHDNVVQFNTSFDEGGGVMVAGQLAPTVGGLSPGSGAVDIERNLVSTNLSNDDGGGIRLLMPVAGKVRIRNNIVTNNVATDAGGGVSVDDALDVEIVGNTIVENVSTATAEDADRSSCNPSGFGTCAHTAGVDASPYSPAVLGAYNPTLSYSSPSMLDNIVWNNRAFRVADAGGLVSAGIIDFEVTGALQTLCLDPRSSLLTGPYAGCVLDASNIVGQDPRFAVDVATAFDAYGMQALAPGFVSIVVRSTPADPQPDRHLLADSPAIDAGAASVTIGATPQDRFFVSTMTHQTTGPFRFRNEDVLQWDGSALSLHYDGSDVGQLRNLDALEYVDPNRVLFSIAVDQAMTGLGTVDDSDILRFTGALGATTTGTHDVWFDGSDVGLTTDQEDVDAMALLPDGDLLVSTLGAGSVPGVTVFQDEDLLRFTPSSLGPTTAGTWSMYFDGSDVGLSTSGDEDVDGVYVRDGDLYLSTLGVFAAASGATAVSGDSGDVFVCRTPVTGAATSCAFDAGIHLDNAAIGLAAHNLDAIAATTVMVGGTTTTAPADDFDGHARPNGAGFDIGADERY